MNNEVYAFALKNALDEIQNACPDVSNTFIFKDGKLIAKSEVTNEQTANSTIASFDAISERTNAVGGLEAVTVQGANGRVNIACINDFYLTTVSSKDADEKYVNTLTRVLIPIVIKLAEKIRPASADDEILTVTPEPVEEEAAEEEAADVAEAEENAIFEEETATEPTEEPELIEEQQPAEEQETPEVSDEPLLPDPPVTQFIVENLGGLLVPSDTVRIDKAVIAEWNELYRDKNIAEVDIETIVGRTTRCKIKPIKDSKHEGKGTIQVPEKVQFTLEVTKGELVMVKPVVE